ncbi:MAG: hypothetical protein AB7O52_15595 [Planctomycetota bacterium]
MPRATWVLLIATTVGLAIGRGDVLAQTVTLRLQAVSPSVAPGGTLQLDVFLDNPSGSPIGGYQIAVAYPANLFELSAPPTLIPTQSVLGSVFSWNAPLPFGLGFGSCPLWDDGADLDVIAAIGVGGPFTGTSGHLFRLEFQCIGVSGDTGLLRVSNTDVACTDWAGSFAVNPQGGQVATQRQNESVVVTSLAPVTNVTCFIETVSDNVQLNWSNGDVYDELRIYRGSTGQLLTTLVGTATSFVDALPPPSPESYFLVGVVASVEAPWVGCLPAPLVIVPPVTNLVCVPSAGVVNLTWTNAAAYSQIEVYRNGALVGTLSGTTTAFDDTGAGATGIVSYFVIGYDGVHQSPGANCLVNLDGVSFVRGDANGDLAVNVSDVQASLSYIFGLPNNVSCAKAADFTDDGTVALNDPVQLLTFLFSGGAPPVAPFPLPGVDPTPDAVPCS